MAKCPPDCTCGRHDRRTLVCPRCGEEKTEDQWYQRRNGTGRGPWCKDCHAADGRERRLRTLFSLTLEDYDKLLAAQLGGCAICGSPPQKNRLAVDHDHKTGLVRGLLCWACNSALGKWRDDRDRVLRAAEYIRNPPAVNALGREVFGVKGRVTKRKKRQGGTNGK